MTERLEVLLHLTRKFAKDSSFNYMHPAMASGKGAVKMLDVTDDPGYPGKLREALDNRFVALGLLGFEEAEGQLQAYRFLFPWHEKDPILSGLFERLCEGAVKQVQEEFEKRHST